MSAPIVIDQARIDAPRFPRPLEWWRRWAPCWLDASLDTQGRVVLEPSGRRADGHLKAVTPALQRRHLIHARRWLDQDQPRIAVAIVSDGRADR